MTRLKSMENDKCKLEVVECTCGFHIGIDASYLTQVADVKIECPSCDRIINTEKLLPEYF